MAELLLEHGQELESTTVKIYRTAATIKGGRRFSFGALVVVGDRHGSVGIGYGKAPGVPAAIEKAQKQARKRLVKVNIQQGTIPHPVNARFGASSVRLLPAAPGTGVIAGGTVRAVLELAGVKDCLSKAYGSTNEKNLVKAVLDGLQTLRTKDQIAEMRGVTIDKTSVDERIEAGARYAPQSSGSPAQAPKNTVKSAKGRERGGRGGDNRGRGRGRGPEEQAAPQPDAAAAPAAAE